MIAYRLDEHLLERGTDLHLFRTSTWWSEDTSGVPRVVRDALLPVGPTKAVRYDDDGFLRRTVAGSWLPTRRINDAGEWEPIPPPGHAEDPWAQIEVDVDRLGRLLVVLDADVLAAYRRREIGRSCFAAGERDWVPSDRRFADVDALVGQTRTIDPEAARA